MVTFDFANNKIYLKKGREFARVDESDMSGLHLLRISSKTVVQSVDRGSPAQEAGIRAGDIVVKVEAKEASAYKMWELRRILMSEDKRPITITIERTGDLKDVCFLLKKKI